MTDKVIHYDSDEAAQLKTVTGWVSSDGRFYGKDEHLARWAGCTHKACGCGNLMTKSYTICDACREVKRRERYIAMPEAASGDDMVFSDSAQEYFQSVEDAAEYAVENDIALKDMDLICCEPRIMREVEYDYWEDDLADDSDFVGIVPTNIRAAIDALNELIAREKPALSWWPSKCRVSEEEIAKAQAEIDEDLRILNGSDL